MANRFQTPFPEFFDDNGNPREGARLFFYTTGTAAKLDTYSDASRSIANTNPIVLNEFGRPDVAIFLKDQDYKVVLVAPGVDDPPTSSIWTADPVRPSDIVQMSIRKTGSGSPTGVVAGTAGSAGVLPTEYWDYTNNILYECTTTGTISTAVWTAINSTSNAAFFEPAGRLTLTSGTGVLAADVASGTAVYYTPFKGNAAPIYSGTTFTMRTFTELTLTLHSSHTLNGIFDVFLIDDSGVLTLVTGPAWATPTAAAGARGTGAGTTQISRTLGMYTNTVSMTGRNGATTYTVGANRGLYLGSLYIDGTAGQVSCHISLGQNRKFGVWNAFNRRRILLQVADSTAAWAYTTSAWRASNNSTSNKATVFAGLPEEEYDISFTQIGGSSDNNSTANLGIGIGWNSTTSTTGKRGIHNSSLGLVGVFNQQKDLVAGLIQAPSIGINDVWSVENGNGGSSGAFNGSANSGMLLTARYFG